MKYSNITEAKQMASKSPALYAIASPPEVYIGSTSNLKRRMIEHSYQLKSRPEKQEKLSAMIERHGQGNCEVFVLMQAENLSKVILNQFEAGVMQLFSNLGYTVVSSANMLNISERNNFFGKHHSKEVKEKASRKVRFETKDIGVEFDSVSRAASMCKVSPALIVKNCTGKREGWSYSTDVIKPVDLSQIKMRTG